MQLKLLEILACPKCLLDLSVATEETVGDEVIKGYLECGGCSRRYPIESSIPRFVERDNYADTFGYQWNKFKLDQLDSCNGKNISGKRFYSETNWTQNWLKGQWILDAGCGAGRFIDIASQASAQVVGLDMSDSVDAVKVSFEKRDNVHLVQGNMMEPPFKSGVFDGCYCIGVIQHTPDPSKAIASLPRMLKSGARIALTIYERKPWTLLYSKYLIRPIANKLNKFFLLFLIRLMMPVLFPITEVLFRIPVLNKVFRFILPIANYVDEPELTLKERYQWAILDTFDMLAPRYDQPQNQAEVERTLMEAGVLDIQRLNNDGLNVIGNKK
jgi:ubiquinone/menaquinone biosynthesis C-methylase UbiE/uncharacterized protein YbaR (Trm112 family)